MPELLLNTILSCNIFVTVIMFFPKNSGDLETDQKIPLKIYQNYYKLGALALYFFSKEYFRVALSRAQHDTGVFSALNSVQIT